MKKVTLCLQYYYAHCNSGSGEYNVKYSKVSNQESLETLNMQKTKLNADT